MLISDYRGRKARASQEVIVPIDRFVSAISEETGWTVDILENKDLGDIEKHLEIRAKPPVNSLFLKRGKSRTPLYSFVDQDTTRYARTKMEKILSQ